MMSPHSSTRHGTLTTWCRQGTVWLSAAAAVLLLLPVALLPAVLLLLCSLHTATAALLHTAEINASYTRGRTTKRKFRALDAYDAMKLEATMARVVCTHS